MEVHRIRNMEDIKAMVALGLQMHAESAYAGRPVNADKMMGYGVHFLSAPDQGVAILAKEGDDVFGMMAGWATSSFFNDDIRAQDMLLYVRPDKRGSRAAYKLVKEFERWAEEIGAVAIGIGITAGIDNDRATSFYNALGYKTVGAHLNKEF